MKKFLSLLLALSLSLTLALPALAASDSEEEAAAWKLYHMGLFQGTGTDTEGFPIFSLSSSPTRAQGITMLVRLLGQEEAAQAGDWTTPFTDVPDWALPYVGYAYEKGLTLGTTDTAFSPDSPLKPAQYLTFVLRAMGYEDGTDFAWDSAWTLTDKLGITKGTYSASTTAFDRGDVAWISAQALDAECKTQADAKTAQTLADVLEDAGITYNAGRCTWAEECVTVKENKLVFTFSAAADSKETYKSFEVTEAYANGVKCEITQYTTPDQVKAQCRKVARQAEESIVLPNAFALVYLSYDEAAAKAAATETVTANLSEYPVITLKLHCVGTLTDNTKVTELVTLYYYIDGYTGIY